VNSRTFASFFDGIYGFGLGLEEAGWECVYRCEIDEFRTSITTQRRPGVMHVRDIHDARGTDIAGVGLICGGFPCQDLSVAGQRRGFAGDRSSLFFELVRVVAEARPRWLLWENVPGLLSSPPDDPGADFWAVNAALAEIGYFGAWRVLDSKYFGVAQQRRRLYGLYAAGSAGATRAAAVLLEPEGRAWHSAARREKGEGDRGAHTAATLRAGSASGGPEQEPGDGLVSVALNCHKSGQVNDPTFATLVPSLTHPPHDGRNLELEGNLVATSLFAPALRRDMGDHHPCVSDGNEGVRRLTPIECERLQGFPDGWTIPPDKWTGDPYPKGLDSARYRACGDTVTTNVIYWLGLRINLVEDLLAEMEDAS